MLLELMIGVLETRKTKEGTSKNGTQHKEMAVPGNVK